MCINSHSLYHLSFCLQHLPTRALTCAQWLPFHSLRSFNVEIAFGKMSGVSLRERLYLLSLDPILSPTLFVHKRLKLIYLVICTGRFKTHLHDIVT